MRLEKFLDTQASMALIYESLSDYLRADQPVTGVVKAAGGDYAVIFADGTEQVLNEDRLRAGLRWNHVKGKIGFRGGL